MSTLAFILIGIIILIFILSHIPGLQHFAKPLVDLITYFVKMFLENIQDWLIWIFKFIWRAHSFYFRNLLYTAEEIDPTYHLDD